MDHLSDYEADERAAESKYILENPVFVKAMEEIYSRAVGILLSAEVGSLTATQAHATMKAIVDIQSQLKQYVTDQKMRRKYKTGNQDG